MSEQRLKELGLTLPHVPTPVATYVPFKRHGDLAYLSGVGPRDLDGSHRIGKVGADVTTEEAYQHARTAGLGLLAVMRLAAGSLDKVEVLKLLGMVNATPDFTEQPQVINGCSDLFVEVLDGDRWSREPREKSGRHPRVAGQAADVDVFVEPAPAEGGRPRCDFGRRRIEPTPLPSFGNPQSKIRTAAAAAAARFSTPSFT